MNRCISGRLWTLSTRSVVGEQHRAITTTAVCNGRRNFRKFPIINKRGVFEHSKLPKELLHNEYAHPVAIDDAKIRYPGVWFEDKFVYVREMEPELVVPDGLDECPLKPYVSYRAEEVTQSPFTAQQLFNVTYGRKIYQCYREEKPIPEELLTEDQETIEAAKVKAKNEARKVGADLFSHTSYFGELK